MIWQAKAQKDLKVESRPILQERTAPHPASFTLKSYEKFWVFLLETPTLEEDDSFNSSSAKTAEMPYSLLFLTLVLSKGPGHNASV